jgi:hypothetical protein
MRTSQDVIAQHTIQNNQLPAEIHHEIHFFARFIAAIKQRNKSIKKIK